MVDNYALAHILKHTGCIVSFIFIICSNAFFELINQLECLWIS